METTHTCEPWNKGKLIGQKPPLKPKEIWAHQGIGGSFGQGRIGEFFDSSRTK